MTTVQIESELTQTNESLSLGLLKQINGALKTNDIDEYKRLFEIFVNDPKMNGYFDYNEQTPTYDDHHSVYPYCECTNKSTLYENMKKFHEYHFIVKCNCKNGKYYILLHNAYNFLFGMVYYSFSIPEILKRIKSFKGSKCEDTNACNIVDNIEKNNKPEIIAWIESLHYETKEFSLMFDWNPCHTEQCKFDNCDQCDMSQQRFQVTSFSDKIRTSTYANGSEKNIENIEYVFSIDELREILEKSPPMVSIAHSGIHDQLCDILCEFEYDNIDHCDDSACCFLYATKN